MLENVKKCLDTLVEERDGYISACVIFASGIAAGEDVEQMIKDLTIFDNQPKAQAKAEEILRWMIGIYEERKKLG